MLDGILPAPRGVPQIEVSFDMDANGILSVRAHDKGTGKEQKITITASSGLEKDEIEKMQKEAEAHAAEDEKQRDKIETFNTADTLVYSVEKTLRENKDKISEELNTEVEEKVKAVRDALTAQDVDTVKQATQDMNTVMQKIGEAVYQQQPPPPEGETPSDDQPPADEGEGTVEGEFREV
jgi:molecular chaperone DnaK